MTNKCMSRELNFDLIKTGIENALKEHNVEALDDLQFGLRGLISQMNDIIRLSVTPGPSDLKLLDQATRLYFLTISNIN
ncbi:MAG: hypothetical protein ACXACY_20410 [Candidatus Hodarchaeales archaeon]|jgi:hypothetical protein